MIVPPEAATKDIPRAYREGCQASEKETEPQWCRIGDLDGEQRAVVVGDSKILQYYEAFDAAGKALGWQLMTATKSQCAFSDAAIERRGKPYGTCSAFNRAVMARLRADPPDAVITGQGSAKGFFPGAGEEPTEGAMVRGLVSRWQTLSSLGIKVVVVLDNLEPHDLDKKTVYACMLAHPHDAKQCAFKRETADNSNGFHPQSKAAALMPATVVIDIRDYICPGALCPPVIGDVLVYRQGSHITNTYALTLAPLLTRRLQDALDPELPLSAR